MSQTSTPHQFPALDFPMQRGCPYQPPQGYDDLRKQGPVTQVTLYDGRRAWLVSGYAEGRALLPDARLSVDVQNPDFPFLAPRIAAQRGRRTPLVGVDDPDHARQRRMIISGLSLRRIAALRAEAEMAADRLLTEVLASGTSADLVEAYALHLPSIVICSLLGVPHQDHHFFDERSRFVLSAVDPDDARKAFTEVLTYLTDLIAKKQAEPGDGLLDQLIAERLAEGDLDRDELAMLTAVLLVSGHETTSNMISLSTMVLLQHPEQLAILRAEPGLWPGAIDELMRFTSIGDTLMRVAVEDIDIAGQRIRAGDGVIVSTMQMNRDPAAYQDADSFDVRRVVRGHVAFGHGIHQCVGQNLARMEMEVALRALFARVPTLTLMDEQIPVKPSFVLQGVEALPVTW